MAFNKEGNEFLSRGQQFKAPEDPFSLANHILGVLKRWGLDQWEGPTVNLLEEVIFVIVILIVGPVDAGF